MAGNTAEVLRRIHENKRTKAKILDLSGLGLTELPDELWDCVWVEELRLGKYRLQNEEGHVWADRSRKINNRMGALSAALSNFKNLTKLNQLCDISSLKSLVNLTVLDLSGIPIIELSVLKNLSNLTKFYLTNPLINDIGALSELINLTKLCLLNPVKDLSALSKLVNLTYLDLIFTESNDISALSGLVNLTHLDLSCSKIKDISALNSLVNLTHLNLIFTKIKDISALNSLVNLTHLDLSVSEINDVSTLSGLVNLTHLDLSCSKINDISPISGLVNLTHLDLSNSKIKDISALRGLVNLTHLDLNDNSQFSNIGVLSSLVNLTYLDISVSKIKDISSLRGLVNLTYLDLNNTSISDISVLSNLVNLTNLSLSSSQISDINVLGSLVNLTNLSLSSSQISDINVLGSLVNLTNLSLSSSQISDISVLGNLVNLTNLSLSSSQISDISVLGNLVNLTNLSLSSSQISDISVLGRLVNLTSVSLSDSQISDINALSSLPHLTNLYLWGTSISDISGLKSLVNLVRLSLHESSISYFPFDLLFLPKLETLNLKYTHFFNLPSELTQEENSLPDLKNYYAELQRNAYTAYDAKIITVGNGRVGKTSMLKTLFQLGHFDPQEDSTHGIQLFETNLSLLEKQATANLSLWDFGGQELYHATHRIFMQTRALYLVVWDPETEAKLGEVMVNLHGQDYIFRNYPLSYWLGNVRALSKDAKIIVICNKVDDSQECFPKSIHELQTQYNIDSFISISAKTGYGIPTLHQRIQYLLDQTPEMGLQMPNSWRSVREKLANFRSTQQYISLKEYNALCETETLSEGSMKTPLRFLHHSGFLFWHEKYLQDQIILDQKWALEAIYQLLDRNGWYPLLKGNALRQRSELAKCWRDYKTTQVNLFLEIMQSCELALKLEDKESDNPRYLIPEFLPDTPALAVTDIWKANPSPIYHFRFQHPFFHAALIQRFIVRSAKLAERYDLLWRTGLLIKVDGTMALIQVYPEVGRIDMQLRGANPAYLLERLKNEITKIQEVRAELGFFLSLTGHTDEWVTLEQLKQQITKGKAHIASTTGEILELAPFFLLLSPKNSDRDDNHKALGLKELSDRESGSQLLAPVAALSKLEDVKNQIKNQLIDGIPSAITLLRQHIATNTATFDNLILIHGQYQRYHEDLTLYDVLSGEQRRIGYNRIQKSILELVNSLEEGDVKD